MWASAPTGGGLRAADDRPYERERRADVGIGPYGRGFAGGR